MRDSLAYLAADLDALAQADLLRSPQPDSDANTLVLCSNDYLGYAARPFTPSPAEPAGAGASRLVSGDSPTLRALEDDLAGWLGYPAALLFSSGYAANVGLLSALAGPDDVIVSDALNHASIIDGCRLSRARVVVVPHLDTAAVERALIQAAPARHRFVVSESYFSMDGDIADVRRLRLLCDAHHAALLVDEAHALGVLGPAGRGICAAAGIRADALIGTLGKAVGAHGAFVVGSTLLRHWLFNRARSFVFSTGPSPAMAAAIRIRLAEVIADNEARQRVAHLSNTLRRALVARHAPIVTGSIGPIVPWLLGGAKEALQASLQLREQGIFVSAIRPPTVPVGSARLRITVRADLSDTDLARAMAAFSTLLPPR